MLTDQFDHLNYIYYLIIFIIYLILDDICEIQYNN